MPVCGEINPYTINKALIYLGFSTLQLGIRVVYQHPAKASDS